MARILFTWEIGEGTGHVMPLLALAKRYRAQGAWVAFALRDVRHLGPILADQGFLVFQAPFHPDSPISRTEVQPASMADILCRFGFAEPAQLAGLQMAWVNLLQQLKIQKVVASYAPISLLCARSLGLSTELWALPFELPPPVHPCPRFRVSDDASSNTSDSKVLSSVNTQFKNTLPEITAVFQIFAADQIKLMCWPELDCYRPRPLHMYAGPSVVIDEGLSVNWPESDDPQQKRIFFYFRADHPRLEELRRAAQAGSHQWIGVIRNTSVERLKSWRSPTVWLGGESLRLSALLPGADLVVNQGGQGMVSAALLHGKPLLMLPCDAETMLTAKQVVRLGAGQIAGGGRGKANDLLLDEINASLGNASLTVAAKAFGAQKHRESNRPRTSISEAPQDANP